MRGSERAKPARSLLKLPLAADAVAPLGLVPGDGHVDEPLEEVPLVGVGGTPGVLERFMRLEVPTGSEESESLRERS